MKLAPLALALTAALLWGGAILIIGLGGVLFPGYGDAVLSLVASIYPGYDNSGEIGDLLVGAAYAFFDGLVGGFVLAVVYNFLAGRGRPSPDDEESLSGP